MIYFAGFVFSPVGSVSGSEWLVRTSGARVDVIGNEEDDMDHKVCPVVRWRACNLPSSEATRTTSRSSESLRGSGAGFSRLAGPKKHWIWLVCEVVQFTISAQDARSKASTTATYSEGAIGLEFGAL